MKNNIPINCIHIKDQLFDYHDGLINEHSHKEIHRHIIKCDNCQKELKEIQMILGTLESVSDEEPDIQLENEFLAVLEKEKTLINNFKKTYSIKALSKSVFKYAALILLLFSSYVIGYTVKNKKYKDNLAVIKEEKNDLKSLMTISLIENQSASKRIQGVQYAQEITDPKDAILNVLFNKMKYDEHISVRLASAQALKRFSKNDSVVIQLIKTLEEEKNQTMQLELIEILADIKEKRAIPVMEKLLKDKHSDKYVKEQIQLELNYLI